MVDLEAVMAFYKMRNVEDAGRVQAFYVLWLFLSQLHQEWSSSLPQAWTLRQ